MLYDDYAFFLFTFFYIQSNVPITSNVMSQYDLYARKTLLPCSPCQVPTSWCTTLTLPQMTCICLSVLVLLDQSYLKSYQDHQVFSKYFVTRNKIIVSVYQFIYVSLHGHFSVQTFSFIILDYLMLNFRFNFFPIFSNVFGLLPMIKLYM